MEIYLGHGGSPCLGWNGAAHFPAGDVDPVAGSDGGFEHAENASANQHRQATLDQEEEWADKDDEDGTWGVQYDQYGLPQVSGADVCVLVDKSRVHQLKV